MRQTPAGGSQLALCEDTGDLHHRHFTHRPTAWLMCRRILCMPWCLPVCGIYMYSVHDSYILMHVWLSHINQLCYGKKLRQCSGMLVCQSCSPVLLGAAALSLCWALCSGRAACSPLYTQNFPLSCCSNDVDAHTATLLHFSWPCSPETVQPVNQTTPSQAIASAPYYSW